MVELDSSHGLHPIGSPHGRDGMGLGVVLSKCSVSMESLMRRIGGFTRTLPLEIILFPSSPTPVSRPRGIHPLRQMYQIHWLVLDRQAVLRERGGKGLGIDRRSRHHRKGCWKAPKSLSINEVSSVTMTCASLYP